MSGKSTKALLLARRLELMGLSVLLVRPECSRRKHETPGILTTKTGETWPARELDCFSVLSLDDLGAYSVLWIDEPNIFKDEKIIPRYVQAFREQVMVIVSCCPGTSELGQFGTSPAELMAVADSVVWCKADCHLCGTLGTASRSYFKLGKKTYTIHVGGDEAYEPRCPTCWTEKQCSVSSETSR